MKRWIVTFLGLILTVGMSTGCQQKCFIAEKDFYDRNLLPPGLEDGDPTPLVEPTQALTAAPRRLIILIGRLDHCPCKKPLPSAWKTAPPAPETAAPIHREPSMTARPSSPAAR